MKPAFEAVAYAAEMVRASVADLPDHRLPEGVAIRPVSEDQLRAIWGGGLGGFRDHWGYVEPTEESYARFLAFTCNDFSLRKVAWDEEIQLVRPLQLPPGVVLERLHPLRSRPHRPDSKLLGPASRR